MIGAALAFLRPYGLKLSLYAAVALGVLAILAGVRKSGRDAERVANLKRAVEAENARKQVDVDVAGADDVELKRLRKRWRR